MDDPPNGPARQVAELLERARRAARMGGASGAGEDELRRAENVARGTPDGSAGGAADGAPRGAADPWLLEEVARARAERGEAARAEALLEEALELLERTPSLAPSHRRARLATRLGLARVRLGRLREGLGPLRRALEAADDPYAALQLGNALRRLGDARGAAAHLDAALRRARADRDAALALGALCGRGELALELARGGEAVEAFGEALGIAEHLRDEAAAVVPLAGLAQAHALWTPAGAPAPARRGGRAPAKALELAERAAARAARHPDLAARARAGLALGALRRDADELRRAEADALAAPHAPLALECAVARLELEPSASDGPGLAGALERAEAMGMAPAAARLRALRSG